MDRTRTAAWSAFLVGLIAGPIATLLLVAAARIHASLSGWGYAVGAAFTAAGLLSMPWRRRRGLTRAGLGLMLLVASARLVFAGGDGLDTLRLPSGDSRLINRLVAERDGTLLAAHMLLLTGQLPRSDARDFLPALDAAFDRIDGAAGPFATPAAATWLGLQSPEDFDMVVIPPEGPNPPEAAVVALHGYTGNFAVYCWQLSRAARAISALTVCPSVGPLGDWWSRQGEETLKNTLAWLERRGIRRVYLAGLSNGGVGASVLAGRLAHSTPELRGLLLISGASRVAEAPRVPVLLVQGQHDSMFPARRMRAFAERAGKLATSVEIDSGHFAFLDHAEECERAIASWLRERERDAPYASSHGYGRTGSLP
jgi:pimeloyl-ACP methyl ester carboxylesterase